MILKILELVSILLAALTLGVFWGPWIGLTRSMSTFGSEVFLAIVHRMDRNLGSLMTALFPITLLSIVAVLVFSFGQVLTFSLALGAFVCLVVALAVTARVEVPIVEKIRSWTIATMPGNWQQLRDRWVSFHLVRVLSGFAGLGLLASAAIFVAS